MSKSKKRARIVSSSSTKIERDGELIEQTVVKHEENDDSDDSDNNNYNKKKRYGHHEDDEEADEDNDCCSDGGGGGENEADEDGFASSAVTAITLDDMHQDISKPHKKCWGCKFKFGIQRRAGDNPNYDKLSEVYYNYKDDVKLEDLAEFIYDAHQEFIYEIELEQKKDPMYWSYKQIVLHLRKHMTDLKRLLEEEIRTQSEMAETIASSTIFRKGKKRTIHKDNMKAYTDLSNLRLKYITQADRMRQ